jgi:hypothetical protein
MAVLLTLEICSAVMCTGALPREGMSFPETSRVAPESLGVSRKRCPQVPELLLRRPAKCRRYRHRGPDLGPGCLLRLRRGR